jgi:hypothetical protein
VARRLFYDAALVRRMQESRASEDVAALFICPDSIKLTLACQTLDELPDD